MSNVTTNTAQANALMTLRASASTESLKQEYLKLAEKLHKLPPADLKGLPWVQRRKEIRGLLEAAGEPLPRLHEVRV